MLHCRSGPQLRPCATSRSVLLRACKTDDDATTLGRRSALLLVGAVAASAATLPAESSISVTSPPPTPSPSPSPCPPAALGPVRRTLIVDPREEAERAAPRLECASDILVFRSVEEAVEAAAEGDVISLVASETLVHSGRAVLSRPGITLTTLGFSDNGDFSDNDDDDGASRPPSSLSKEGVLAAAGPSTRNDGRTRRATLSHETSHPYESTVSVSAPRCRVVGLTIMHSSPSVANNYALHVEEAAASEALTVVSECDVASSSGTALGLDSAARVSRCRLASNSRFGVSVFAPGPPRTKMFRCELVGGGGKGVKGDVSGGSGGLLVRGGDVEVRECFLSGDPFAMRLVDGTGFVSRCAVGKGKVEEGVAWEGEVV